MNLSPDRLAQRLEAELGTGSVTAHTEQLVARQVAGKTPALVCAPENPDTLAAALRICNEAGAAVIPWGSGTAMRLGNPPAAFEVALLTNKLNQLIEHDHANLTATVKCGMRLAHLQQALAPKNQAVPFDPPFAESATIGGIVSTNLNGPCRTSRGSVRDLVIGMKVALPTGEQIKAGGKVVKNVAGYDMCKLFTGALGTLGVITEVTVRMAALAERRATFAAFGTLSEILQFAGRLSRSSLFPAAVVLSNRLQSDSDDEQWQVTVLCEGFGEAVARQIEEMRQITSEMRVGSEVVDEQGSEHRWTAIRDFPLRADASVYRITVPRALLSQLLKEISESTRNDSARVMSDAQAGVIWIALPPTDSAAQRFSKLITLAREQRGHAVMFAAPHELKSDLDVWGPPPATLPLMREIKRQFDPRGILNPGRFLRGL